MTGPLIDRNKPRQSPYPVSTECPRCGASAHRKVKPATGLAFTRDRVCAECSTRYTPPGPWWARVAFAAVGLLLLLAGGLFVAWGAEHLFRAPDFRNPRWYKRVLQGLWVVGALLVPAVACILMAFTRWPKVGQTRSAAGKDQEHPPTEGHAETRPGDVANRAGGEPDPLPELTVAAGAGRVATQRDRSVAKRRRHNGRAGITYLVRLAKWGCGQFAVLTVVLGAIAGARGGASLVDSSVLAYLLGTIGALIGAVIVGLVVLVIYALLVFDPESEQNRMRSEKLERLEDEVRLRPDDLRTLLSLGDTLEDLGRHSEASEAYQKASRFRTDDPKLYVRLAEALKSGGRPDEAIRAYQEALRLNSQLPDAHFRLGLLLRAKGRLDEAIAEFREAIRLENDNSVARYNLGLALRDTGRFDEAIAAFREVNRAALREVNRAALRETELMARAADRLPAVLEGKDRPRDAAECLVFTQLCQLPYLKRYAAAARFFDDAFTKKPDLAEDLRGRHRYSAASLAARAGCGQGGDAARFDENERARLRRRALDWLRADLNAWGRLLDNTPDNASAKVSVGNDVILAMERWLADPDLAGVRGPEALARLPEAERQPWRELWDHAAATQRRGRKTLDHWVGR